MIRGAPSAARLTGSGGAPAGQPRLFPPAHGPGKALSKHRQRTLAPVGSQFSPGPAEKPEENSALRAAACAPGWRVRCRSPPRRARWSGREDASASPCWHTGRRPLARAGRHEVRRWAVPALCGAASPLAGRWWPAAGARARTVNKVGLSARLSAAWQCGGW